MNPGFSVKGARLTMGGRPRQFGIDEQALAERPDLARSHPSVRLLGIHAYLGTRILDPAVIAENSRRVLAWRRSSPSAWTSRWTMVGYRRRASASPTSITRPIWTYPTSPPG